VAMNMHSVNLYLGGLLQSLR